MFHYIKQLRNNLFCHKNCSRSVLRNPTGGRFPKRVYSKLNGHATEITYGAGRQTEISRRIETSVEEIFWP